MLTHGWGVALFADVYGGTLIAVDHRVVVLIIW
jgi:hypothetical protein